MQRDLSQTPYLELKDIKKIISKPYLNDEFSFRYYRNLATRLPKNVNWLLVWKLEDKGMTVRQLAEKSGVEASTIKAIISRGPSEFITQSIEKICKVLRCNPQDIGYCIGRKFKNSGYQVDVGYAIEILETFARGMHQMYMNTLELRQQMVNLIEEVAD